MIVVSLLPHAECGPNSDREHATHFTNFHKKTVDAKVGFKNELKNWLKFIHFSLQNISPRLFDVSGIKFQMNQNDWDIPSCRIVSINKSSSLVFDNLEGILSFDLRPDEVLTISIAFGGSKIDQFTEKSGAFLARRSVWVKVGANIGRAIL